jgi:PAS domain S-box-containing protein
MLSPLEQLIFLLIRNIDCPMILQEGESIVYATSAMTDLFGYTQDELIVLPALDLIAFTERQRIRGFILGRWSKAWQNNHIHYQADGRHKDGSTLANLTITVCTFPQDAPPYLRLVQFEKRTQENLYAFAVQAAASIHGWNKTNLHSMAAEMMQGSMRQLETQLGAVTQRLIQLEAARAQWRTQRQRLLKGAGAVGALLGQEFFTGSIGKLLAWLWS